MIICLFNLGFAATVVFLVITLAYIIGYRINLDREKSSPFECGFDPKSSARISFSLRFFLLAVIFLIFDIEIIFFFPVPFIVVSGSRVSIIIIIILALLVLILGLLHEWREGSLDWSL